MLIESTMLMEKEGKFDSSSQLWKLTDITVSGRGNNSESSRESRKCGREERKVGEESEMVREDDTDHFPGHALHSLSLGLQSMYSAVTSVNKQRKKNTHTCTHTNIYIYEHIYTSEVRHPCIYKCTEREGEREGEYTYMHQSPVLPKLSVLHLVGLTKHIATSFKLPVEEVLDSILL